MTKIGSDTLDWDYNGQLVTSVTASLEYNHDGKLRSGTVGSDTIDLKYDPRGSRVYKESTVNSVTTKRKYIVDIASKLPTILIEIDPDTSSLKKTYMYAGPQVLVQTDHDADENYFYLHDRLGSVRMVVDDEGTVKNTYTYDPFGNDFATEVNETVDNNFKFTGQWYDSEINQYYLRARMYDPALMRFTSVDPVKGKQKQPLTLHRYLYCTNDPINCIDLTGKFASKLLVEPIIAGYSVHYGAVGTVAYGASTGNWNFISLGIAMEKMVAPVMAISMMSRGKGGPTDVDKAIMARDNQALNNSFGNFSMPPGGKWVAIAMGLAIITDSMDGNIDCKIDSEAWKAYADWFVGLFK